MNHWPTEQYMLSAVRMQDFLSLYDTDCLQFPDRRYKICLLRHYLVDILIGKPTCLHHIAVGTHGSRYDGAFCFCNSYSAFSVYPDVLAIMVFQSRIIMMAVNFIGKSYGYALLPLSLSEETQSVFLRNLAVPGLI